VPVGSSRTVVHFEEGCSGLQERLGASLTDALETGPECSNILGITALEHGDVKLTFSKPAPRMPKSLPRTDLPAWNLPEPKPCPPDPLWKDLLVTTFFSLTGGSAVAFVAAAGFAKGIRGGGDWTSRVWIPAAIVGLIVAAGIAVFIWMDGGYPKPPVEDERHYDGDSLDDMGLR
jgi:hypothetical protein